MAAGSAVSRAPVRRSARFVWRAGWGSIQPMRRLIALILLLIVPLQLAWSAAMGMHVHPGGEEHAVGVHFHDHDLHASAHAEHDHALPQHGDEDADHDDNHHVSHCHHVYSAILALPELTLGQCPRDAAPAHPAARFTSHTPFLPDPPPPARA